ncbi:hypothetical protein LQ567_18860 [Niabella pedocola]|uniref:Uncharacterized protein n=1 Tax=Niabella pedocola TaxID=1752077 RepID=A0ABS8PY55_9BACT|nr:hypothetical protein [Niabella pedocola]MCD2424851.1 hypothetical protein [Niabella pedocola]
MLYRIAKVKRIVETDVCLWISGIMNTGVRLLPVGSISYNNAAVINPSFLVYAVFLRCLPAYPYYVNVPGRWRSAPQSGVAPSQLPCFQ